MKTSELTGDALDWAVAEADGVPIERKQYSDPDDWVWYYRELPWSPSTDWAQGGPIIEREFIHVHGSLKDNGDSHWFSLRVNEAKTGCQQGYGPTPLIAAMRCYVSSVLGDEVNVPEELQ